MLLHQRAKALSMTIHGVLFCFCLLLLSASPSCNAYDSLAMLSSQSHHLPTAIRQLLPSQFGLPRDDLFIGISNDDDDEGKLKYDAGVPRQPPIITSDKEKYDGAEGSVEVKGDKPADAVFFLKKKLAAGQTFDLSFHSCLQKGVKFLAVNVSDAIPFSTEYFHDILSALSVDANSTRGNAINETLSICDRKEPHFCSTSLPKMIAYVVSSLGPNVSPISSEVLDKESSPQVYHLESEAKKVSAPQGVLACHILPYAYPVFYCHQMNPTSVFQVSLRGTLGAAVNALAICHEDTSKWNPNHIAFHQLNVKPGSSRICHFLIPDDIAWLAM